LADRQPVRQPKQAKATCAKIPAWTSCTVGRFLNTTPAINPRLLGQGKLPRRGLGGPGLALLRVGRYDQMDSFGSPRRLSPSVADLRPIRVSDALIVLCLSPPPAFANCEPPPLKRKKPLGACSVFVDWARSFGVNSVSEAASSIFIASNIGWPLSSMAAGFTCVAQTLCRSKSAVLYMANVHFL
jgi:hypothetical protein